MKLKENTTLGNVINLAGGLSPKAYPRSATLERITDDGFVTSVNLDLKSVESLSIKIKAGDHIKINAIKNIKKKILLDFQERFIFQENLVGLKA